MGGKYQGAEMSGTTSGLVSGLFGGIQIDYVSMHGQDLKLNAYS